MSSYIKHYQLFIITYPVLYGIGIGFSYMGPIISGWEYFPHRKGTVSGIILLGFGLASFIFGFVSLAIVNPDNEQPELSVAGGKIFGPESPVSMRVPRMLRIYCAIWLALLLISLPLIRRKQMDYKIENRTESQINLSQSDQIVACSEEDRPQNLEEIDRELEEETILVEPTFREALFDYRTIYIWFMMILSS